jgi:uroporphyrin-III C-methyltransferase / precorrin-2 dehydrogenase / sirohydrochlorin ferrochelatase
MPLLPIFLKLNGRRCLLVGAGKVALDKTRNLFKAGASLCVVAPQARPELLQLAQESKLTWFQRKFQPSDLDGSFLVIAATNSPEVNTAVYQESVKRGILCNSVDDITHSDFFFGSVVSRGNLQIAISTAGESPAFTQHLRREIDELLPQDLGPWLEDIGRLRRDILVSYPPSESRRLLLHQLAQRSIRASEPYSLRQMELTLPCQETSQAKQDSRVHSEKVYLVGAGPGDPDLLTVKALRLIQAADVILHDDLVSQAILDLASPSAEIVNVGKRCGIKNITQEEINTLMIEHARAHQSVVRLKGGDPLLFGRAAEEIIALVNANVPFETVPGITAAFAAAAAAGCSLTDRNCASSVIFSTGQHAQMHKPLPPRIEDVTRVVYMPGRDLTLLAQKWLQEGLSPELPCALVSRASQPDQQIQYTTLASLGDVEALLAPSLLIAGWTVRKIVAIAYPAIDTVSVACAEIA